MNLHNLSLSFNNLIMLLTFLPHLLLIVHIRMRSQLLIDSLEWLALQLVSYYVVSLGKVVSIIQKKMTICSSVSSTRPSYFLHITLYTFRHVKMHHTLQVGKIQSHPQRYSRHHDLLHPFSKLIQSLCFLFIAKTTMIDRNIQISWISYIIVHLKHDLFGTSIHQYPPTSMYDRMSEIRYKRVIFSSPSLTRYSHV